MASFKQQATNNSNPSAPSQLNFRSEVPPPKPPQLPHKTAQIPIRSPDPPPTLDPTSPLPHIPPKSPLNSPKTKKERTRPGWAHRHGLVVQELVRGQAISAGIERHRTSRTKPKPMASNRPKRTSQRAAGYQILGCSPGYSPALWRLPFMGLV